MNPKIWTLINSFSLTLTKYQLRSFSIQILPQIWDRRHCLRRCWCWRPCRQCPAGSGWCQLKRGVSTSWAKCVNTCQLSSVNSLGTWPDSASAASPLWFGLELFFSDKLFLRSGSGSGWKYQQHQQGIKTPRIEECKIVKIIPHLRMHQGER